MSETRMTPEAMEAHEGLHRRIDQLERELSAAKEELAKLRQHAEAMADELREPMALRDYRADFPEDAK